MDIISFKDVDYPLFQAQGNASQFAIPFAKYFCQGKGVDIGFHKEEWKFPNAIGADLNDKSNVYHALCLPEELDYIYSSHCLEHIADWVSAVEYWSSVLKTGGILFLYLPHRDQEYWLPWNNRKHLHVLDAEMVKGCMEKFGFKNIMHSDRDLNHSFIVVGEKHG
jgi:predicted SAM-dependent methyltransferase